MATLMKQFLDLNFLYILLLKYICLHYNKVSLNDIFLFNTKGATEKGRLLAIMGIVVHTLFDFFIVWIVQPRSFSWNDKVVKVKNTKISQAFCTSSKFVQYNIRAMGIEI